MDDKRGVAVKFEIRMGVGAYDATHSDLVIVVFPVVFDAVNETLYIPDAEYDFTGFCIIECVPSPNDQFH